MNVVRVMGGLGNQLFQYAFGKALQLLGTEVAYDLTCYKTYPRPYLLDHFHTTVVSQSFIKGHPTLKQITYPRLYKINDINFWGFWQTPMYHKGAYPVLKEEFQLKEEYYTPEFVAQREEIRNCNSVSLHVRRGDYIGCGFLLMTADFYQRAINFIKTVKRVDRIYVFSDDITWCKENLKGVTFVHMQDYLDFELMKACKHNIIANSTFSWWAAYLNENPQKMVVASKNWRIRKEDRQMEDQIFLLLEDWVQV